MKNKLMLFVLQIFILNTLFAQSGGIGFSSEVDVQNYLMSAGRFKNAQNKVSISFSGFLAERVTVGNKEFYQPELILANGGTKAIIKCVEKGGISDLQFVVDGLNNQLIDKADGRVYKKVGFGRDAEEQAEYDKAHANDPNPFDPKYDKLITLASLLKNDNKEIKISQEERECHILYYNASRGEHNYKSNYFKGYVKNKQLFDNKNIYIGDIQEDSKYYFLNYTVNNYYEFNEDKKTYIDRSVYKRIYVKKADEFMAGIRMRGRDVGFYNIEQDAPEKFPSGEYTINTNDPNYCLLNAMGNLYKESVRYEEGEYLKKRGRYIYKNIYVPIVKFN